MTASTPTRRLARRRVLSGLAAASLAPWARLSLAATASARPERFVLLLLRGGMDGLMAVAAPGDPAFELARGPLAHADEPWLPLHGPFGLHPLLPSLHDRYRQGELAVVHAVGLPYRERSHFDAQQVLESGGTRPHELTSGWLGRALQASGQRGVAFTTAVPLALRGAAEVDTWAPSSLPEPAPDLVARLEALYADDPALTAALARARLLRDDPALRGGGMAGGPGRQAAVALAGRAADLLRAENGPGVAMLELGGWDSHTRQAAPQGATANNLRTLDAVLAALRDGLTRQGSTAWARTVVLVATEFGREVAVNGNGGHRPWQRGRRLRAGWCGARWPGAVRLAGPGTERPLRGPRPAHHDRPAFGAASAAGRAPARATRRARPRRAAGQCLAAGAGPAGRLNQAAGRCWRGCFKLLAGAGEARSNRQQVLARLVQTASRCWR